MKVSYTVLLSEYLSKNYNSIEDKTIHYFPRERIGNACEILLISTDENNNNPEFFEWFYLSPIHDANYMAALEKHFFLIDSYKGYYIYRYEND